MNKRTLALVATASAVYYTLLFLLAGLSVEGLSPLAYLAPPLLVFILILMEDLSSRATVPTNVRPLRPPTRKLARDLQELTRQIEVGSRAGEAYFGQVLQGRLREILVEKVSLETGLEKEHVQRSMADSRLGPDLLRDAQLYMLLYSRPPGKRTARVKVLQEIVARIEAWKP